MIVNEDIIEIYFSDLNEEAQEKLLSALNLISVSDGNFDVYPIARIPSPETEDILIEELIEEVV